MIIELFLKLAANLWPAPAIAIVGLLMYLAIEPAVRARAHRNRRGWKSRLRKLC